MQFTKPYNTMEKEFKSINPASVQENFIKLIGSDGMLITAGNMKSFNTMTAGWGSVGHLWHKPVAVVYVRPTRYTYGFMEKNDAFTLCFFEKKYQKILDICGSRSGKDTDKIKETGLIPLETEQGNIYYEQSRLVLECRKMYADDIHPEEFIDGTIDKNYPLKDYHRMYIGEITGCYKKE